MADSHPQRVEDVCFGQSKLYGTTSEGICHVITLNGLFLWLSRIGSVIREQRPAAATTRKSCCSLNAGVLRCICGSIARKFESRCKKPTRQPSGNAASRIATRPALDAESVSSSTGPVNRLQATGEPRRVMPVGSKSYMLGSEGTEQTRATYGRESCCFHQRNRFLTTSNSIQT
jgi:hypothetical protein